ncbi:MAG: hypothetical protein ACI4QA_00025 [Candidatus Spyradosoma sp.]
MKASHAFETPETTGIAVREKFGLEKILLAAGGGFSDFCGQQETDIAFVAPRS